MTDRDHSLEIPDSKISGSAHIDIHRVAKNKRLLLSEVYVHKYPKLSNDEFGVFHIFELDDNDSKIVPKLSTNCSEPKKVIEILQNFTGSETPQLQRLINKLCEQNKSWNNQQKSKTATCKESNNEVSASSEISTKDNNRMVPVPNKPPMKATESPNPLLKEIAPIQKSNESTSIRNADAPVKLWNSIMQPTDVDPNSSLELMVVSSKEDKSRENTIYSLKTNGKQSAVSEKPPLQIDQVFEGVNDDFVKNLLANKSKKFQEIQHNPPTKLAKVSSNTNQNEISNNARRIKANESMSEMPTVNDPVSGKRKPDMHGMDLRCNYCLESSDSFYEHKTHMNMKHGYTFVCDICREPFKTRSAYDAHHSRKSCVNNLNASRPYICIVEPPVILIRENKLHAFKCKHCQLAFVNQKNYVQHAQRHATKFRCKICHQSKPMTAIEMKSHLLSVAHCSNNGNNMQ